MSVSNGFVSAHILNRIDMDSHLSLGTIREFDVTFDPAHPDGNPLMLHHRYAPRPARS